MQFKGIVFDLDGTLLDSLMDIGNSMNAALVAMGCPPHPIADYKIHVGDGMSTLAYRVLPEALRNDNNISALVGSMRREYGKRWAEQTRPYDGIAELLNDLVGRGIKMSIVSNKPEDFTNEIAVKLLPQWKFDPIIGARANLPHKPHPAGAIEAATGMNLPPAECAFLGDTYADVEAAVGAGMYPVGALWGFREAPELLKAGAKFLIKHPRELLNIFAEPR